MSCWIMTHRYICFHNDLIFICSDKIWCLHDVIFILSNDLCTISFHNLCEWLDHNIELLKHNRNESTLERYILWFDNSCLGQGFFQSLALLDQWQIYQQYRRLQLCQPLLFLNYMVLQVTFLCLGLALNPLLTFGFHYSNLLRKHLSYEYFLNLDLQFLILVLLLLIYFF